MWGWQFKCDSGPCKSDRYDSSGSNGQPEIGCEYMDMDPNVLQQQARATDSSRQSSKLSSRQSRGFLSNALEQFGSQMGEDPSAGNDPSTSSTTSPRAGNTLLLMGTIRNGIRSFQKTIETHLAANDDEVAKGIYIDRVYDFYDPWTKKPRLKKVTEDVIHRRKTRKASLQELPEHLYSPRAFSEADDSSASGDELGRTKSKDSASSDESDAPQFLAKRSIKKLDTLTNMEIATSWGVLVGKLLNIYHVDIRDVTGEAIGRQRVKSNVKTSVVLVSVTNRALSIVNNAMKLAKKVASEDDIFDGDWGLDGFLETLFSTEYVDTFILLANASRKLFSAQPVLVEAKVPARVFGDIHGQFRDVLMLFHAFGSPIGKDAPSYVFNGDFVDRGSHQLEVLGLLFALKLAFPEKVWMVRGNHEGRSMNESYGFLDECILKLGKKFGIKIFDLIQKTFEQMPLACRVEEKILVVHGGIGNARWNLSDVRGVRRPLCEDEINKPENQWIFDLLWSDPIEDSIGAEVFGVHGSPRGKLASQFAWDVTKTFCARNGLSLIVRSHQSKHESIGFEVMHENLLMRVFSARDYEGHGNDAAVLLIKEKDDGSGLLHVRPQVLRSTTKLHKWMKEQGFEEKGTERQMSPGTSPKGRRKSVSGKITSTAASQHDSKEKQPSQLAERKARKNSTSSAPG